MKNNTRRSFLIGSSLALGAVLTTRFSVKTNVTLPSLEKADNFFVVLGVAGGLDSTLGLDPKTLYKGIDEKDLYLEYRADEILHKGNIRLGPSASSLLEHSADIAIVNGISAIRDSGHGAALEYALTGSSTGSLHNHVLTFVDKSISPPLGVLSNSVVNMGSLTSSVSDLSFFTDKLRTKNTKLSVDGLSEIISGSLKKDAEFMEHYEKNVTKTYDDLFREFSDKNLNFISLASLFANNFSTNAFISLEKFITANNVDSHSNHPLTHFKSQKQAWDMVADIFKIFKNTPYRKSSLFNHTTFIVLTEFSRLPFLNLSAGKDHNPFTNSALFAGKNIRGNRVIGESIIWSRSETSDNFAIHSGLPINFQTGEIVRDNRPDADFILNESIARTIYALFNESNLPDEISKFKVIPNLIKT